MHIRYLAILSIFIGAPVTSAATPAAPVEAAHFERGLVTSFGATWSTIDDKQLGGDSSAAAALVRPGAKSTGQAMRISGEIRTGTFPFPFAGVVGSLTPPKDKKAAPKGRSSGLDLSRHSGVRFWARGDGKRYQVRLFSARVPDFNQPSASFVAATGWHQYEVPFSEFQQLKFGSQVPWADAAKAIIALGFMASSQPGAAVGAFDISVDEISFF
jgi:hypothetical protein